ncbi:MAG: glycosyl hydrolase 115 family protein [Acidobacteriaceae bacterium]|jgi:hypothetical protein
MRHTGILPAFIFLLSAICSAQSAPVLDLDRTASPSAFPIAANGKAAAIYVAAGNPETVRVAAEAFAADVERVTGVKPQMLTSLAGPLPADLILVGVLGKAPEIDALVATRQIFVNGVAGKWESAVTTVVASPMSGVHRALVIAGSDRRGAAYALFQISREMGVSPWTWWADVPVAHHAAVYVRPGMYVQPEPSVEYRGIFLNDEDWGLRPWAAKKMDPAVDNGKGNIGPNTYEKIFELLLRLHANSLWPAMHPGSLAFNAVPENAKLADKWGIVMGSSHSEALLRNNVGEWSEKAPPEGDGPWNFQTNSAAMIQYWDKRLVENGKYENFYTVGLRGVHDSGLEATGSPEVKAKLVEDAMTEQRKLLAARVSPDLAKIPQIIWLYKESLDLYRVGMKVPDDVTLGWTDDNYGYIRELPNAEEQKRAGGSGVYYHVSYWGAPHDYLWLCTTPPALIQEEMTKAYDHNARKYWILNVGDLKPAEIDIDYFMQLATDEPKMAKMSQREWLTQWFAQQFPTLDAKAVADVMTQYYALNFIRKPEFMGFNGYNDGIKRTDFNPLAWGELTGTQLVASRGNEITDITEMGFPLDQNHTRADEWDQLRDGEQVNITVPKQYASAFFELVGYPVEASSAQNDKFLATDFTYLDAHKHDDKALAADSARAKTAYDTIQALTAKYNALEGGKWDGMMSDAPRERHVFEMPKLATAADADTPLPASWGAGDSVCTDVTAPVTKSAYFLAEEYCTVSVNAAHFARKSDTSTYSAKVGRLDPAVVKWNVLADLGISGDSVVYGRPGLLADLDGPWLASAQNPEPTAWLEYDFTTTTNGAAALALHLLPTFPVDSDHKLRYAVALDGGAPMERDMSGSSTKAAGAGDGPSGADWPQNVLRNSAVDTIALGVLAPGKHTLRLLYRDPGVVFEHIVITFPGAPPAYPVPPETR